MGFRSQKAGFLKKYWIYGFSDEISVSKKPVFEKNHRFAAFRP